MLLDVISPMPHQCGMIIISALGPADLRSQINKIRDAMVNGGSGNPTGAFVRACALLTDYEGHEVWLETKKAATRVVNEVNPNTQRRIGLWIITRATIKALEAQLPKPGNIAEAVKDIIQTK